MWTANINQVRNEQVIGTRMRTVVNVTFTDGTDKSQEDLLFSSGTKEIVFSTIQGRLDDLNAIVTFKVDIPLGPFTPPAKPTPTAAELAKATYAVDLATLTSMVKAISFGIKTSADADYVALLASLKTRFLSSYLDLFR